MKTAKTAILAGVIALVSVGGTAVAATPDSASGAGVAAAPCGTSYPSGPGGDFMTYRNCGQQTQYIRPYNTRTGRFEFACRTIGRNVERTWTVWKPVTEWVGANYTPTSQCS
ncbi:hypothetical protein [Kibdelosporangium phytohabitans]|nr:hypothetical protein [Kibdelosporangium phytohabitans]MBE1461657.1 hypothetical protein [Kibdelosporangium phytohabitans]